MKTVIQNRFDGGMVNDPRDTRKNVGRVIQHFDVFTDPHKLIPHYTQESGSSAAADQKINNFAYNGTTIFGLGEEDDSGTNFEVYTRTSFDDGAWTGSNNFGAVKTNDAEGVFFTYYRKTDAVYGVQGNRYVWKMPSSLSGPSVQHRDLGASAFTTVSNGVVHSKDDCLYFGYNNKIAKNNNDTYTNAALTLPSQYVITSICEYGDFLAIGCKDKNIGSSRVFLWDRNETTTTLSESIDWEQGDLFLLEELEGYLVGVSSEISSANVGQTRFVFRYYAAASGAVKFHEFTGFSNSPAAVSSLYKHKQRHRILFPARISVGSTTYPGIWAITKTPSGFAVVLQFNYLNTYTSGSHTVYGLIQIGDFLFASYISNGTQYLDKTNENVVYTQTSTFETVVNPNMEPYDRLLKKQLDTFAVFTEKLTSGQQVVAKYRVDGGDWTTIFTKTSTSPDTDLIGYESTVPASNQFTAGREYEFRLESTGGAVITGYAYKYHTLQTQL